MSELIAKKKVACKRAADAVGADFFSARTPFTSRSFTPGDHDAHPTNGPPAASLKTGAKFTANRWTREDHNVWTRKKLQQQSSQCGTMFTFA